MQKEFKPDKISQRILQLLQTNARLSYADIAKQVHLSAPAVAERVRKLEEEGIILGYVPQLNLQKLGFKLLAWIQIKVFFGKESAFVAASRNHPSVLEWYNLTGDKAYLLKVAVENMQQLESLLDAWSGFAETSTMMVLSQQNNPSQL